MYHVYNNSIVEQKMNQESHGENGWTFLLQKWDLNPIGQEAFLKIKIYPIGKYVKITAIQFERQI